MKRFTLYFALTMVVGLLMTACTPTSQATEESDVNNTSTSNNSITVIGQGEAIGVPDQAEIHVGVETSRNTVAEATTANEATMQAIIEALAAQGIASEDVQTTNYNLWAEQDYGYESDFGMPTEDAQIRAYRVGNVVRVVVRNTDKIGDVLTAVTDAGANSIHGIYFTVADPSALEAQARESAMANARARANSLAELGGVTLGDIKIISEVIGGGNYPMPMMDMAIMESSAFGGSMMPGQQSYHVQIQVTFTIQ